MASHASRARAGRPRARQSKWADSTRRCTRTALAQQRRFCLVTIPARRLNASQSLAIVVPNAGGQPPPGRDRSEGEGPLIEVKK
jgi:hypothetical protein